MFGEPVQTQSHGVILFESLSPDDGIIDAGCIARDRAFFTAESILDFNFFVCVYSAIEWHCHLLAMPVDCFGL